MASLGHASPQLEVLNEYLEKLRQKTQRATIIYATNWATGEVQSPALSIVQDDVAGFMQAVHNQSVENLDLLLHTPGGSPDATSAIVTYLREKFKHIRVIIPHAAMSAGTMLACAADEIVMAKHSSIGPIDPQFLLPSINGYQYVPALAIVRQFNFIEAECLKDSRKLDVWLPVLQQFGPALLQDCKDKLDYSKQLVTNWLKNYMFSDDSNSSKPIEIAEYLTTDDNNLSHGRPISAKEAITIGLKVKYLESDNDLQDLVLSVYHATNVIFNIGVLKIIGKGNGDYYMKFKNR